MITDHVLLFLNLSTPKRMRTWGILGSFCSMQTCANLMPLKGQVHGCLATPLTVEQSWYVANELPLGLCAKNSKADYNIFVRHLLWVEFSLWKPTPYDTRLPAEQGGSRAAFGQGLSLAKRWSIFGHDGMVNDFSQSTIGVNVFFYK